MNVRWTAKRFDELTPAELYGILRLRSEVFVVEQKCVFLDADNKDLPATHCMGWDNMTLIAYSRVLPAGVSFTEASIGRVVTSPDFRGGGWGKKLMQYSLAVLSEQFGSVPIRMGCQLYLKKFYESFGFRQCSDVYIEDGIEHIEMIKNSRP